MNRAKVMPDRKFAKILAKYQEFEFFRVEFELSVQAKHPRGQEFEFFRAEFEFLSAESAENVVLWDF